MVRKMEREIRELKRGQMMMIVKMQSLENRWEEERNRELK